MGVVDVIDFVWNLIDTFPTLLECAEAADYYIETVRVFLTCVKAVAA